MIRGGYPNFRGRGIDNKVEEEEEKRKKKKEEDKRIKWIGWIIKLG